MFARHIGDNYGIYWDIKGGFLNLCPPNHPAYDWSCFKMEDPIAVGYHLFEGKGTMIRDDPCASWEGGDHEMGWKSIVRTG